MSKPRRQRLTALAGAFALLVTLSACSDSSGGEPGNGDSPGDVTIRFTWWGSDTRHQLTQEIIDLFEEENPHITVVPEFAPFSDYWDKLNTIAASRELPDVMQITDPYMYGYIDNGLLVDLADVSSTLSLEHFPEPSLFTATVDGSVYGVPAGESGFAVLANPEIFEEAGIPIPDDETWTWESYIETATQISETLPGIQGSQIQWDEQMFTVFVRQRGEDLWLPDGSDIGFTVEGATAWFELLETKRDSGGFPAPDAAVETAGLGIEQSPLVLGTSAMQLVAVPQLGAAEAASGVQYEILNFPGESVGEVGMYTKPGIFYGIATNSEHPEEAALLIDFLVNRIESAQIAKFDRGVASNTEILSALEADLTDVEARMAGYFERIHATNPRPFPHQNTNGGPVLVDALNRFQEEVLFDRMTPEQAAQGFVDEINGSL